MGQTAQCLTCSIMEKPHTGLDDCLRILLSCFRARNSAGETRWSELSDSKGADRVIFEELSDFGSSDLASTELTAANFNCCVFPLVS